MNIHLNFRVPRSGALVTHYSNFSIPGPKAYENDHHYRPAGRIFLHSL